ncbi:phosphoribosyltransferase [Marivita sp.]|uniref:phosphoribosyltransferase n=1 Tax=Marivita sp. TaxID=2003365 RepID=UPI0025C7039F|nr:phosphoribosyltransferase [Marivita sp.]
MPSSYEYGTFANYSPRGRSELSVRSRGTCGGIKAGRINIIESAIPHLNNPVSAILQPFLAPDVTFIPIPRSAPLKDDALWPGRVICDVLHAHGFGREVQPYLERVQAVTRSSSAPAADRPLYTEHMETIQANVPLFPPEKITLVDDVLTMGRTCFACAELLRQACPQAEIRIFAMIRTQGLQENIERIVDPAIGIIVGYPSGKTHRDP